MSLYRNRYFLLGILLVLLGIQFRMVESFVLNERATRTLARMTEGTSLADNSGMSSMISMITPRRMKRVEPPRWLGPRHDHRGISDLAARAIHSPVSRRVRQDLDEAGRLRTSLPVGGDRSNLGARPLRDPSNLGAKPLGDPSNLGAKPLGDPSNLGAVSSQHIALERKMPTEVGPAGSWNDIVFHVPPSIVLSHAFIAATHHLGSNSNALLRNQAPMHHGNNGCAGSAGTTCRVQSLCRRRSSAGQFGGNRCEFFARQFGSVPQIRRSGNCAKARWCRRHLVGS